jgi:hypothetical protein
MAIFFHSVTSAQCAKKLKIKGNCINGFKRMVEMCHTLEEDCQDWGIENLNVDDMNELIPFVCILGND